eukprot:s958_g36.t1
MALAELQTSSTGVSEVGQGLSLEEVRKVVRKSFDQAYSAVIVAARAHEELCKKTEQLKNNPDAVEKLKRGLLDRFRFIFDSLGGSRNPDLQEFRVQEDTEKALQEMAEEDENQRKMEEEFAAEVWNHAGRKISESVVGFLGLDDDDDDGLGVGFPGADGDDDDKLNTGAASSTDFLGDASLPGVGLSTAADSSSRG